MTISVPADATLIFMAACAAVTGLSIVCSRWIAGRAETLGLRKVNFQGQPIVGSLGLAWWMTITPAYALLSVTGPFDTKIALGFTAIALASGLLGFLDDRFGSRDVGGFRGHFGELRRGRLTTGAAKALLLPPIAAAVGLGILGQGVGDALLTVALVCLCANTINLLDVRPARAATAWIAGVLMSVVLAALVRGSAWPALLLLGPVIAYLPDDIARRGMMGDVGANLIGAVLGLQIATAAQVTMRLGIAGVFLGIQLYSERHSLSARIDSHPYLRWLDILTRFETDR